MNVKKLLQLLRVESTAAVVRQRRYQIYVVVEVCDHLATYQPLEAIVQLHCKKVASEQRHYLVGVMPIRKLQELFLLHLCREYIDTLRNFEPKRLENPRLAPSLVLIHNATILVVLEVIGIPGEERALLTPLLPLGSPHSLRLPLPPLVPCYRQVQVSCVRAGKEDRDYVGGVEGRGCGALDVEVVHAEVVEEGRLLLVDEGPILF